MAASIGWSIYDSLGFYYTAEGWSIYDSLICYYTAEFVAHITIGEYKNTKFRGLLKKEIIRFI